MQHLTRVGFILRLMQLSISHTRAAEPSKISFGFSSIGGAGTGVWMFGSPAVPVQAVGACSWLMAGQRPDLNHNVSNLSYR
jgi:hypothetical protein